MDNRKKDNGLQLKKKKITLKKPLKTMVVVTLAAVLRVIKKAIGRTKNKGFSLLYDRTFKTSHC